MGANSKIEWTHHTFNPWMGCALAWIRSILRQCREAGVPVFVKQLGANPRRSSPGGATVEYLSYRDRKGANPDEWPADLRVREMPQPAAGTEELS